MYAGHFDFAHPLVWTIDTFYSNHECERALDGMESYEWLPATVNARDGRVVAANIRDNSVAVLREPGLAEALFLRAKPNLPASMNVEDGVQGQVAKMALEGFFSPLRIYRYEPGQHFGLHEDQSYQRDADCWSLLTFMIYLNDDFDGGQTDFPPLHKTIAPKAGTALVFQHRVLHAGLRVTRGIKYVLRTDVLYRRGE